MRHGATTGNNEKIKVQNSEYTFGTFHWNRMHIGSYLHSSHLLCRAFGIFAFARSHTYTITHPAQRTVFKLFWSEQSTRLHLVELIDNHALIHVFNNDAIVTEKYAMTQVTGKLHRFCRVFIASASVLLPSPTRALAMRFALSLS